MSTPVTKEFTYADWTAEARRRFGVDTNAIKFVCPACGHVASVGDYRKHNENGSAGISCIGRFDGHMHVPMGTKPGPCNYAGFGLFRLNPVKVTMPDGAVVHAFDFAEAS